MKIHDFMLFWIFYRLNYRNKTGKITAFLGIDPKFLGPKVLGLNSGQNRTICDLTDENTGFQAYFAGKITGFLGIDPNFSGSEVWLMPKRQSQGIFKCH